jgi:hypothetical protein
MTATKTTARKLAPVDACNKVQRTKTPSTKAIMRANNHRWAHAGVALCVGLSAILNACANYHHASKGAGAWAIMLGIAIPALVFILARVGGSQWRMQSRRLAIFTACMGAGLLGLSIHHCGDAISMLTGMSTWEGVLMAVAVDGGLVACELETVLD